ncbi:MAG TPA: BON domain-containing protein [Usitatibacter sp.]|nr:BON domain-containing protein [Usitatibacter sp.]
MSQPQKAPNLALLVPLSLAAFAISVAIVACDHEATRAAAPAPESFAQAAAANRNVPAEARTDAFRNTVGGATTAPRYASSESISDTVITGKIKAGILADPGLSGADVSVNTDHGVVTLTGNVKSQEQTAIASAHAQRQDGVMRVDNHLTTTPE